MDEELEDVVDFINNENFIEQFNEIKGGENVCQLEGVDGLSDSVYRRLLQEEHDI